MHAPAPVSARQTASPSPFLPRIPAGVLLILAMASSNLVMSIALTAPLSSMAALEMIGLTNTSSEHGANSLISSGSRRVLILAVLGGTMPLEK